MEYKDGKIDESLVAAVSWTASLAKINFDSQALTKVLSIIRYFDELDNLDVQEEELFYPTKNTLFFRDENAFNIQREELLNLVPERLGLFIKTPLIIESKEDA